jgi:hypothetical protein
MRVQVWKRPRIAIDQDIGRLQMCAAARMACVAIVRAR